jgi:glycosyltransferase involved in cell wall biosynthesis
MVLSHRHPALSAGGGERAAYSLFEHLKSREEVKSVIFVAAAEHQLIGHDAPFAAFRGRPDEILVSPPYCDPLTHCTEDYDAMYRIVGALCERFSPDVVHIHHFLFFSIEIIELFRRFGVRVVLTLHEFIAICHRNGQMLKTNGKLCSYASPAECAMCFEEFTAGAFFLREQIIKTMFALVDRFISPSAFLAQRYVQWGVASHAISVIENPLSPEILVRAEALRTAPASPERSVAAPITSSSNGIEIVFRALGDSASRPAAGSGGPRNLSIGFFGQINPYKGADVLLESLSLLSPSEQERIHVTLHGANLELWSQEFQERFRRLLGAVENCVTMAGAYDNNRVLELMSEYDWIIMPSVWWENSPVVIQEALAIGKPLLLSRIGGMAEKGRHAVDVVLFEPGNAKDLARKISSLHKPGSLSPAHSATAAAVEQVEAIMSIYRNVLATHRPQATEPAQGPPRDEAHGKHLAPPSMENWTLADDRAN